MGFNGAGGFPAGAGAGLGGGGAYGGYAGVFNQLAAQESQTSQIGVNSSIAQAAYGANLAAINANGTEAQLALQQLSTQYSVQSDLDALVTRSTLELASKALETSTLIAQYREKTYGLITTIIEQRTNNVWGRIKTLSQGFKF